MTDEEMYGSVEDTEPLALFREKSIPKLYQYDPVETYFRKKRLEDVDAQRLNLSFAKKVIADEHYPAHGELWFIPEGTVIDDSFEDPECEPNYHTGYIQWGRLDLIQMIAACRYLPAIPELREVILHDDSPRMKEMAMRTLCLFNHPSTDAVIEEIIDSTHDRRLLMNYIMNVGHFCPKPFFIAVLRRKWEDYYLDYTPHALHRRYFNTIPQSILVHVCAKVMSIDSLALLEEGMKHPYPHVEHNAKYFLMIWLETLLKSKTGIGKELFEKVLVLGKKYDGFNVESEAWTTFKKLPEAGPH